MLSLKLIILLIYFEVLVNGDLVVMTRNGPLQGISVKVGDSEVEAFLGIPYAEPPIGRLRFGKPVPKTPWSGVYDASRLPPTCIQNVTTPQYFLPDVTNMTEDCLYLNIWVPYSSNSSKLKPIFFFIHGGAFNTGSSNMKIFDGAKFAASGDVVVVTINYRVGVMGFFSAFIPDAAGNMGIYDQIMALEWIRENAVSFNGDVKNIALAGESAGAMSVAGHMLSPLTKHKFKRAILQSGAAVLPMVLDGNERVYKLSQTIASMAGCADKTVTIRNNPKIIVDCLKRLPAKELAMAEGHLMGTNPITFIPVSGDEYLPKNSIHMMRDGAFINTELLIGVNKHEGTFFLAGALPQYFGQNGINPVESLSKRLAYQLTRMAHKALGQPSPNEIADFYVNSIENGTTEKYIYSLSESFGDYLITCNAVFHADFHSLRKYPVYFYVFSHRTEATVLADWMGTTHFDELPYIFGNPLFGNFTEEEELISKRMMDRWISFVKTGNPNVDGEVTWPRYSYKKPSYLDIDDEDNVGERPDNSRCEFWRDRYLANLDNDLIKKIRSVAAKTTSKVIHLLGPVIAIIISKYLVGQP